MTAQNSKKRILVVEDEQDLLTILQIRLSRSDYQVFTASNGDDGLELASSLMPDAIILDIMMPVKDGFSMLRELKGNEETCHIPIIVVTARDRIEELCTLEGADKFLVKPFDFNQLEQSIRTVVSCA